MWYIVTILVAFVLGQLVPKVIKSRRVRSYPTTSMFMGFLIGNIAWYLFDGSRLAYALLGAFTAGIGHFLYSETIPVKTVPDDAFISYFERISKELIDEYDDRTGSERGDEQYIDVRFRVISDKNSREDLNDAQNRSCCSLRQSGAP